MRYLALSVLLCLPACAQYLPVSDWCERGGITATVPSLGQAAVTPRIQASYPNCFVQVQDATGTAVEIFSDSAGAHPLSNPFQSSSTGLFTFFAPAPAVYTVTFSGSAIPVPFSKLYNLSAAGGTVVYNVKTYGAAGDGIRDDTVAVGRAVTALCASAFHGQLYFPAGRYSLSSSTTVSCSNIQVLGDGRGATTWLGRAGSYMNFPFDFRGDNVFVHDLTFDGNAANGGSALRIPVWSGSLGYVIRNAVQDPTTGNTYIAAASVVPAGTSLLNPAFWSPQLTALSPTQLARISDAGYGLVFHGNHTTVDNVEIEHTGNFGITYANSTSGHSVTRSFLHDPSVPLQGNNTLVIGIVDFAPVPLIDLKIDSNTIENWYVPTTGPGVAGAVAVNANMFIFTNNFVHNCLQSNGGTITNDFDAAQSASYHAVASNNIILQDIVLNSDATGGFEYLGQNLTVTGNVIIGFTGAGVRIGDQVGNPISGKATVTGNVLTGSSTVGTAGIAIEYNNTDTVENVQVGGNYIDVVAVGTAIAQNAQGISIDNQYGPQIVTQVSDTSTLGAIVVSRDPPNRVWRMQGMGIQPSSSWTGGFTAADTNSTAQYKFYTTQGTAWAIPAHTFNHRGAVMHVKFGGVYSSAASSPGNLTLSVFLDSAQVCKFTQLALPTSSTSASFAGEMQFIVGVPGVASTLGCSGGMVALESSSGTSSGSQVGVAESLTTNPFNSTISHVFDVGAQFSAASTSNSVSLNATSVRFEYPLSTSF